MNLNQDVKVIDIHDLSGRPWFAKESAEDRGAKALEEFPEFFNSPEHIKKVSKVHEILDSFIPVRKAKYENHRANKGKPMTVIKIENPQFPNIVPMAKREEDYYGPLKDLGVEILYSKRTLSYLYRVR